MFSGVFGEARIVAILHLKQIVIVRANRANVKHAIFTLANLKMFYNTRLPKAERSLHFLPNLYKVLEARFNFPKITLNEPLRW